MRFMNSIRHVIALNLQKKNTDTLQMNLSLLFKAQLQSNFHDYVDIIY